MVQLFLQLVADALLLQVLYEYLILPLILLPHGIEVVELCYIPGGEKGITSSPHPGVCLEGLHVLYLIVVLIRLLSWRTVLC